MAKYCEECGDLLDCTRYRGFAKYCSICAWVTFPCPDCGTEITRRRSVLNSSKRYYGEEYLPACSLSCSSSRRGHKHNGQKEKIISDDLPLEEDPKVLMAWRSRDKEYRIYRRPLRQICWSWDIPRAYQDPVGTISIAGLIATILFIRRKRKEKINADEEM